MREDSNKPVLRASTALTRLATLLLPVLGLGMASSPAAAQTTELISVSTLGVQANGFSEEVNISADGRFVVYLSYASNLVPGDTNNYGDIFLRDRLLGSTERISVDSSESQTNATSSEPNASGDGRFVVYDSYASNLVSGDTNNTQDIFVRDRLLGTTERVSAASGGAQANGFSDQAAISADGRYVTFISHAANLVVGDTNGVEDVFLHDRQTGLTTRISVSSSGGQANGLSRAHDISDDGRFVPFRSEANNLVAGDGNGATDSFVHDTLTGITERISVATGGAEGDGYSGSGIISADGRHVAFSSLAGNLVPGDTNGTWDCFVRDRTTGVTTRASVGTGNVQSNGSDNFCDGISGNGRFSAFTSNGNNIVGGDSNGRVDQFLFDLNTGNTERVSLGETGNELIGGNSGDGNPSHDGSVVAFASTAANAVAGDTNGTNDIFVRVRVPQIVYTFIGFNPPVDNLPISNSANAGSAIPVKWKLTDGAGGYVSDLSVVQSLQYVPVACDSQDYDFSDPIEAYASGGSGLQYDPLTNEFIYPWKTLKSQKNTCAVFRVSLTDGQEHFARFWLK